MESYSRIWLGAISLIAIAVVAVTMVVVGGLNPGHSRYRAEFAQAAQIRKGEKVTIAGISVGKVEDLELAGDRVIVDFTVRKEIHLGSETRAAIKLTTLLGSRYVELSPTESGELKNRTIAMSSTAVPYDLQQTLAGATTTFEQVDADRIAGSMATLSQSLEGVPDALPHALNNLKSLSMIIAGRRDQIGSLLEGVDTVTSVIRDQKASLGSLVIQGRDLLGDIVKRRAALERLLASATVLVNTAKRVLDDTPGINEMLSSITEFTRMLAEKDALLRNTLQVLPLPVRNIANVLGSGNAGDASLPAGLMIDSWMCAISGRAKQFNLAEYFKDCK
ncbi:MCE family protein [Mycobacteroides chelonae]|uniref:MCE family protein n=3 Tax=Mycobacteroides chelonae TaxID=1774 RepID=UPI001D0C5330|nr:MlaD family protein [Mycobacteroides chelonae]